MLTTPPLSQTLLPQLLDQILQSEAAETIVTGRSGDRSDSCLQSIPLFDEDGAVDMRLNPRRPILAVSSSESSLLLFILTVNGPAPLNLVQRFDGHTDEVLAAQLLPGEQTLITVSADYHVSRYNTDTIQREGSYNFGASAHCLALGHPLPDGNQYVYVGGADYVIKAYSIHMAAYAESVKQHAAVNAKLENHSFVCARYEGHSGRVDAIAVNPTGNVSG